MSPRRLKLWLQRYYYQLRHFSDYWFSCLYDSIQPLPIDCYCLLVTPCRVSALILQVSLFSSLRIFHFRKDVGNMKMVMLMQLMVECLEELSSNPLCCPRQWRRFWACWFAFPTSTFKNIHVSNTFWKYCCALSGFLQSLSSLLSLDLRCFPQVSVGGAPCPMKGRRPLLLRPWSQTANSTVTCEVKFSKMRSCCPVRPLVLRPGC